jgi:hypothetical protein
MEEIRMKKLDILFVIVVFLVFIVMGILVIVGGINMEVGIEKVPCYDRYGNLIEGLICDEEITENDRGLIVILGWGIILIGFCMTFMFYEALRSWGYYG